MSEQMFWCGESLRSDSTSELMRLIARIARRRSRLAMSWAGRGSGGGGGGRGARARHRCSRPPDEKNARRRRDDDTHVVFVDALERVLAVLGLGVGVLVDDARAHFAELALAEVPEHEVLSDAPVRFAQVRVQLGQGRLVLPEREALGARDATHSADKRALRPLRTLRSQDLEGFRTRVE